MKLRATAVATAAAVLLTVTASGSLPAVAVQPQQSAVVSAVPQAGTPQIVDGAVFAVAQVGSTMVVGGSFTQTESGDPANPTSTPYVLAFDAATGAVQTRFAPGLSGAVQTVLPGPTAGTVYVGGLFKAMGSTPTRSLVLLNVADGSLVTSFAMPPTDLANVQTVKRVGNRLYVGGAFTTVGGVAHRGLVTLDATTGAVDPFLSSAVTLNHSWTASSPPTDAKSPVGVYKLDVTADGSKMVAIGNFKQVDGAVHDQIAMWDLTGPTATLRNWNTGRLQPLCNTNAYDSYVRDVDFSPDGSYFSLANSGGYGPNGSLCDSASRWESAATGAGVQPTWVAYTGKDTLLSTAITGEAVYVGGHERWLNNNNGTDNAGPGAVPRPGVAALDPVTGLPLAWNPGRSPRGAGTYVLYATPTGLWMGSDTNYVGVYRYRRQKLAFFPLAGGQPAASTVAAALPAQVYQGTVFAPTPTGVLYRVNAGGPLLQSIDAGPDWAADTAPTSTYRTSGSTATSYPNPVPNVDATVPPGTPAAVFSNERSDPGAKGDGHEMAWTFGVPAGTAVEVRLYFANRSTSAVGARTFDVSIDGTTKANNLDLVASAGDQTGTMRSWTVTSDGAVDVLFGHEVGAPVVSALEVVRAGSTTGRPTGAALTARRFDGAATSTPAVVTSPLDDAAIRGATVIGSTLFYGKTDANLYQRTMSGGAWGAETLVDPYDDPVWSDQPTGSGGVYRGLKPAFYDELPNVTSMFYSGSTQQLYYTLYKQRGLYSRTFSPDSGVLSSDETVLPVTLPDITGAFLSGSTLFFVTRADGNLNQVGFDGTQLVGSPTVASGPGTDRIDWRSRVLFLGPTNQPPVASPTVSCADPNCTSDGSASTAGDGTSLPYTWPSPR